MPCRQCLRPYDRGHPVVLWGRYVGKVIKVHKLENDRYRYRVEWRHQSEPGVQRTWASEQEILAR